MNESEQSQLDADEVEVLDRSELEDEGASNAQYRINSYGADYTVDSLVKRLDRGDIYIPPFQRSFVWTITQSSKFIESLLLGLPVPGIFLSKDAHRKLVVIDGQQRLRTLQMFYDGLFEDRKFVLKNVRQEFNGRTYKTLSDQDRRELDDSILHATIVQQKYPEDDDSSIYQIFERLNTGGTKLQPQEIRATVYFGKFASLLSRLNGHASWRAIYGKQNKHGKDQELILRFLALYFNGANYTKPLNEFLNRFMHTHRELQDQKSVDLEPRFRETIDVVHKAIGPTAFRSQRVINAAVFDSIMVGLARRLEGGPITTLEDVKTAHDRLLQDQEFLDVTSQSTTDEKNVASRIELATSAFAQIK